MAEDDYFGRMGDDFDPSHSSGVDHSGHEYDFGSAEKEADFDRNTDNREFRLEGVTVGEENSTPVNLKLSKRRPR